MKLTVRRIISIVSLLASLVAVVLLLQKPAPVAQKQTPAAIAEHAQSFDQKMTDFQQAVQQSGRSSAGVVTPASVSDGPKPEIRITSDEVGAVLAQSLGNSGELKPDSDVASGAPIKDQEVSFEGDVVHG